MYLNDLSKSSINFDPFFIKTLDHFKKMKDIKFKF
jgi:hypothetical protein